MEQNLVGHCDTTTRLADTTGHWKFLSLYGLALLVGCVFPQITSMILIIYMIIASIKILLKSIHILILFVFLSVASAVFPPIALIEIGLAIYFIIRRFRFFFDNIGAVILGLFIYIPPVLYGFFTSDKDAPATFLVLTCFFVPICHIGLRALYSRGYSFKQASEIMGISPLLVLSLILPFLKLEIMIADSIAIEGVEVNSSPEMVEVGEHIRTAPDGIVENNISYRGVDAQPINSNIYEVSEHIRTAPDGIVENNISYRGVDTHSVNSNMHEISSRHEMVEVGKYIRTAPDGIVENNISYRGVDAQPVNPNVHEVSEHIRTSPDGIIENNLSYRHNLATNIHSSESIPVTQSVGWTPVESQKSPASMLVIYEVTFSILSKFCKADGSVSKEEVVYLKSYIKSLELNKEDKVFITSVFNDAKIPQKNYREFALQYYRLYYDDANILTSMIRILFELALSDGELHPNEKFLIDETIMIFNINHSTYENLKKSYENKKSNPYFMGM